MPCHVRQMTSKTPSKYGKYGSLNIYSTHFQWERGMEDARWNGWRGRIFDEREHAKADLLWYLTCQSRTVLLTHVIRFPKGALPRDERLQTHRDLYLQCNVNANPCSGNWDRHEIWYQPDAWPENGSSPLWCDCHTVPHLRAQSLSQ